MNKPMCACCRTVKSSITVTVETSPIWRDSGLSANLCRVCCLKHRLVWKHKRLFEMHQRLLDRVNAFKKHKGAAPSSLYLLCWKAALSLRDNKARCASIGKGAFSCYLFMFPPHEDFARLSKW